MALLVSLLVNSVAVFITAYILAGIKIDSFLTAILVAIVLGLVNAFLRPVLIFLTLPINILTLGLFTFVIIGALIMLTSYIVPGFQVNNFWWALLFALVLAVVNGFLSLIFGAHS